MSDPPATPVEASPRWLTPFLAVLVFAGAFAGLRLDLASEPMFVDEAAFLSQSYFWDLASTGRWDDARWLEYAAYDLPPLPKYLIGASLQLRGIDRPGRLWAIAWYGDTREARFVTPANLHAARMPILLMGSLGCAAIFVLGTLAIDRRVGLLAAILLMANPLYRLHARRAMADVPAEALILATLAAGLALGRLLWSGRITIRRALLAGGGVGVLAGLAVLAKLNGLLGVMVLTAWAVPGLVFSGPSRTGRNAWWLALGTVLLTAVISFSALNPFVTARPARLPSYPLDRAVPPRESAPVRLGRVIEHRALVSRFAQSQFPDDALRTAREKISALLVQGFGRFGPFGPSLSDSTRRFDRAQDLGSIVWLPWVLVGLAWSILRGRRQWTDGLPPTSWAMALYFGLATLTVGAFLPLAWDRYFLSIQAASALLASGLGVAIFDACRRRMARP